MSVLTLSEPVTDRVMRAENDFYATPRWVVEIIKPHLTHVGSVFDPACGTGDLLNAFPSARREGIELDPMRARTVKGACVAEGDALILDWPDADLCIMNPPFLHARAFIQRAIQWRAQDQRRTVACLARLTILESEERRLMHQQNPSDVYVLATRPKFRPGRDGKMATDSVTCVWLVFGPGRGGRWSVL